MLLVMLSSLFSKVFVMLSAALSEALLGHWMEYDNTRVGVHQPDPFTFDGEILDSQACVTSVKPRGLPPFKDDFCTAERVNGWMTYARLPLKLASAWADRFRNIV